MATTAKRSHHTAGATAEGDLILLCHRQVLQPARPPSIRVEEEDIISPWEDAKMQKPLMGKSCVRLLATMHEAGEKSPTEGV